MTARQASHLDVNCSEEMQSERFALSAEPVLVGNAQDKDRSLRLRSAYAERRRKLDLAMIKGDRRLCSVTWEEVDFGKLVSELR
jgi:hypothetical protein